MAMTPKQFREAICKLIGNKAFERGNEQGFFCFCGINGFVTFSEEKNMSTSDESLALEVLRKIDEL